MRVVSKAQIAILLSKILKDLYQDGNWLDVMSCKRHRENPEMVKQLPIGLLTRRDIQLITEGAIDELKFFQLGCITWIIKGKKRVIFMLAFSYSSDLANLRV